MQFVRKEITGAAIGEKLRNEITLREFCRINNLDPSNWSKIERGKNPPPKGRKTLDSIASSLGLAKGSNEYYELFDYAILELIPSDIVKDEQVLEQLPLFFRTARGEKLTEKDLEKLVKLIRNTNETD